jgi:hypothetical protein
MFHQGLTSKNPFKAAWLFKPARLKQSPPCHVNSLLKETVQLLELEPTSIGLACGRGLVHRVSDWCSGAAAYFGWMREAKRENTRCGL